MAASAVRMSGTVVALQEQKVRDVPRSAKTLMRGSFTFYVQDSYAIAQTLPLCDTDIAGSIAVALVEWNASLRKNNCDAFLARGEKWWKPSCSFF